jgi:hypothetical protein
MAPRTAVARPVTPRPVAPRSAAPIAKHVLEEEGNWPTTPRRTTPSPVEPPRLVTPRPAAA